MLQFLTALYKTYADSDTVHFHILLVMKHWGRRGIRPTLIVIRLFSHITRDEALGEKRNKTYADSDQLIFTYYS